MPSRFIITVTPELKNRALAELRCVAADMHKLRAFIRGLFLVETNLAEQDFIRALLQANPVLIKHIMPVHAELPLTKVREHDLPAILQKTQQSCSLCPGESFAVQCRRDGLGFDYDVKDVEVCVGSYFESTGAVAQFSDSKVTAAPELKVISIYLFEDQGYLGFSTIAENLNEHCDEYRIFSRRPKDVSRAEFKLLEALRKFRLDIPAGRALDLGAAPGGWSKVLADAGLQVVAVDPGELHAKVAHHPNVTHVKTLIQDYVSDDDFDLIVNDMNKDPEISAQIMGQMARHLKPGGYAIMTAKMVIRNPSHLLANIVPILSLAYEVLEVKNLFHNRCEVTMLLRRKANLHKQI
jgi:23S rRNA (cytidine2498-2'-O)-methyltransferase